MDNYVIASYLKSRIWFLYIWFQLVLVSSSATCFNLSICAHGLNSASSPDYLSSSQYCLCLKENSISWALSQTWNCIRPSLHSVFYGFFLFVGFFLSSVNFSTRWKCVFVLLVIREGKKRRKLTSFQDEWLCIPQWALMWWSWILKEQIFQYCLRSSEK